VLPEGPLDVRTSAAVDWFLDMVTKQEKTWLAAIAPEGIGHDPEVEQILREADRQAADRVLEAMGLPGNAVHWDACNALVTAYGGMVKAAGREWLMRGTLDRRQVHILLSDSLLTLVRDVFPAVRETMTADR
jgi:hypothetical protein